MAERDFYKILGVSRSASEADIRKAYRALARKYHPDKNPGSKAAEEKFKDISQARDVLLNKKKRQLYDEFGELGLKEGFDPDAFRQYRSGGTAGPGGFSARDLSDLEELFGGMRGGFGRSGGGGSFRDFVGGNTVEDLFQGARGGRGGSTARPEVTAELNLGFLDAIRGSEQEIAIAIPGERELRNLKVRVPAGVKDGGKIRLRGQGMHGGDVVLKINVDDHPLLRREGDDLYLTVPVTVGEAFHGGKVPVPTLDGEVALTLPRGTKSGAKLRLRGKGVQRSSDTSGDMIVTVQIRLPETPVAERAVDELEKLYAENPRSGLKL